MGAGRIERHAPRLAASVLAVTAASLLGAMALEAANGRATDNGGGWGAVPFALLVLTVPAVGALVAARRPRNPVGWLTVAAPACLSVALLAHAYAVHALRVSAQPDFGGPAAAWLATWLFDLGLGLLPFMLAAFPDGNPAGWLRWPVRVGRVALVGVCLAQAVAPDHLDGVGRSVSPIANPLGVAALESTVAVVTAVGASALVLLFLCAVGDLVVRAVRGTSQQRRQLRWLVTALAVLPVGAIIGSLLAAAHASTAANVAEGASQLVAIVGSALALAVGVLRDGMFELRDYARRLTLTALMTTLVVVGFVVVVSVVATLTSASGAIPPAVAAAVVAIALGPLRGRMQRGIDTLIYGWRSEPYRVLADLGDRLEVTPTSEAALPAVVDSIAAGLRIPYARIDLDVGGGPPVTVASVGIQVADVVRLPLHDAGRRLGELVVGQRSTEEPFRSDELALLRNLARQAGAAAAAAQLTTELRKARAELVRSREDERRRLQRELHDGVGPALAGVGLQLDAALDSVSDDPEQTAELLAAMQRSLHATANEVRRIAHDLRPGVLDELGLLDAVREQARLLTSNIAPPLDVRLNLPMTVDVPAAVEVALFRIMSEAMTNVVRHAHANTCDVRLDINGQIELDVADDGVGFTTGSNVDGIGLHSMRQRAVELGGSFAVTARKPAGTLVAVRLPAPS
jgi:two-component system NarL family sensor kinase